MAPDFKMVRLPLALVERVDAARGDVPRERWVRRLIERELGGEPSFPAAVAEEYFESVRASLNDTATGRETPVRQGGTYDSMPGRGPMCRMCVKAGGPPKSRPCPKCGHQG